MKRVVWHLWQLPQHLIAGLLWLFVRKKIRRRTNYGANRVYFAFTRYGGVSLGSYLFVHLEAEELLLRHELGHCRQSLMLGPLYLIVIGIPSILWAGIYPAVARLRPRVGYFDFYTERWANRLAGIQPTDTAKGR